MTTYKDKQQQLEALSAPFAIGDIRQREEGGQVLNYFESSTIMKRLLEVMGTGYSIDAGRIEHYSPEGKLRRVDMEVIVTLTWVDQSESRVTGWGSSDIQYSKNDPTRIVSDYMKSAYTDGIKVALSKIGVGAALYDTEYRKTLVADKAQAEQEAREKAMFTCQGCQGKIEAGVVGGKQASAEDVVKQTRLKFKKRLCIDCAKAEAAKATT